VDLGRSAVVEIAPLPSVYAFALSWTAGGPIWPRSACPGPSRGARVFLLQCTSLAASTSPSARVVALDLVLGRRCPCGTPDVALLTPRRVDRASPTPPPGLPFSGWPRSAPDRKRRAVPPQSGHLGIVEAVVERKIHPGSVCPVCGPAGHVTESSPRGCRENRLRAWLSSSSASGRIMSRH